MAKNLYKFYKIGVLLKLSFEATKFIWKRQRICNDLNNKKDIRWNIVNVEAIYKVVERGGDIRCLSPSSANLQPLFCC